MVIEVSQNPKQSPKLISSLCFAIWSSLSWLLHDPGVREGRDSLSLAFTPNKLEASDTKLGS